MTLVIRATKKIIDAEIVADRRIIETLLRNPDTEPTMLSVKYLELCTDNFTSKELGRGAFGIVYFGSDKVLETQFAVKRVGLQLPDQDAVDEVTRSFKREISVCSLSLSHAKVYPFESVLTVVMRLLRYRY
jgi:hypothetical protein